MLTLLKCDERARVARAARGRKVASIDRAGRIRTVQEGSVSEERLERGRVASVTLLTPHTVAAVERVVPIGQVVGGRSSRVREVTISTATLGCGRLREREHRREAQVCGNADSSH
jgi:hypothetical protein